MGQRKCTCRSRNGGGLDTNGWSPWLQKNLTQRRLTPRHQSLPQRLCCVCVYRPNAECPPRPYWVPRWNSYSHLSPGRGSMANNNTQSAWMALRP